MKAFNKSLLDSQSVETLESYWKEIFSRCNNHKFNVESIDSISGILSLLPLEGIDKDFSDLSSTRAYYNLNIWYQWSFVDTYLTGPYSCRALYQILNNENF